MKSQFLLAGGAYSAPITNEDCANPTSKLVNENGTVKAKLVCNDNAPEQKAPSQNTPKTESSSSPVIEDPIIKLSKEWQSCSKSVCETQRYGADTFLVGKSGPSEQNYRAFDLCQTYLNKHNNHIPRELPSTINNFPDGQFATLTIKLDSNRGSVPLQLLGNSESIKNACPNFSGNSVVTYDSNGNLINLIHAKVVSTKSNTSSNFQANAQTNQPASTPTPTPIQPNSNNSQPAKKKITCGDLPNNLCDRVDMQGHGQDAAEGK